jgi:hypothetical protein
MFIITNLTSRFWAGCTGTAGGADAGQMQFSFTTLPVKRQSRKARRLFWIANIKIKFPLNIARANASAIPNRPIIFIILFR